MEIGVLKWGNRKVRTRQYPWLLGLIFWLGFGVGSPAFAQTAIGKIPFADPAPQIDGRESDWPYENVIRYTQENLGGGMAANQMAVQLAWDEQYLYLFAMIDDNAIVQLTDDPARIYLNDAVELYIDPLDDSGKRMDINDYQFIVDHRGVVAVLKGDKSLIMDSSNTAPKELGIATVAFQHAVVRQPTWKGGDQGYQVELAVPFAAIGVIPQAGTRLKIDFCVDDVDSLVNLDSIAEGDHLPGFFASNWDGYQDFSFPDHWRSFELMGGPSVTSQISRDLLPYWIWIVLGLVLAAALVIGWQAYRIVQLKDVLPRTALKSEVVAQLRGDLEPLPSSLAPAPEGLEVNVIAANLGDEVEAATSKDVSQVLENAATVPAPGLEVVKPVAPLHPQIERCRRFVLAHLDQDLKMEDLASECALSLRSLQRIFKDEIDMSPGNFVVLLKMERAAELLRSGTCNVSEAAWQLGFQDSSYFGRVFKKYHGVSPSRIL
jgi:AraC-like DNA-binding protein